ncbi:YkvI family membrane protein [Halonatronum saccharophilum]|uniref:YkvI family membrane protein n=1 Tax=Halonatronum saccharophilum TaxID=150060 RepID=UPI00048A0F03|nr:hypothetical protein [Halonatronum saccharophilum]
MKKSLQVALIYIGAVIGAGFASGQEILQFFVIYGNKGLFGILLSALFFSFLGVSFLSMSYNLNVNDYKELFYKVGGKRVGFLSDWILTLFLVGSLIVMLSGSKEVVGELFAIPGGLGLLLTIIIVAGANYYGVEGIVKLNVIFIPLLIGILVFTSINLTEAFDYNFKEEVIGLRWLSSSFIYTGYNLILALTVLLPLTLEYDKKELLSGIFIGGVLLGGLALTIAHILYLYYPAISKSEVPVLNIIYVYKRGLYYPYAITLWAAMITTATCNLYVLVDRLNKDYNISRGKGLFYILFLIVPITRLPFSKLVELIYPQLGRISLGLFSLLMIKYLGGFLFKES